MGATVHTRFGKPMVSTPDEPIDIQNVMRVMAALYPEEHADRRGIWGE